MMFLAVTLAALGAVAVEAGGHARSHTAIVRVFSTREEVELLRHSMDEWEELGVCADQNTDGSDTTKMTDLILVYSKDLAMDANATAVVRDYEDMFMSSSKNWTSCFSDVLNFSAKLTPEEDTYDSRGYAENRHWVNGPNKVFKSIMGAMLDDAGPFKGEYKSFFLMEMDAVPIMPNWLDRFETEAMEMESGNMAIRGSLYIGDKWDLFKHVMPDYLVHHINGNAIYNLMHPWTKTLYDMVEAASDSIMDEMAFDVAYAMITMSAKEGTDPTYAAAWTQAGGTEATYNSDTMLIGNYANTLLNKSFEFGTYIRHGSSKNLFDQLDEDDVTLGVAAFDTSITHLRTTMPTTHPFKKILMLAYYDTDTVEETVEAPGDDIELKTQKATMAPYMHLCEVANLVDTDWFALTDNYHIINAPVTILMDDDEPVLPYVAATSRYCGERPNCKASLDQAEILFGEKLDYHHEQYEVLYKTEDAKTFCGKWEEAAENKSWGTCELSFGPTADDYIAWKVGNSMDIKAVPKDKTRYGWRTWTSLWTPAPVDTRSCATVLYGEKEYLETLGNISHCSLNVENSTSCSMDETCMWKPMFGSGVCLLDPAMTTTTTTMAPTTTTTTTTTTMMAETTTTMMGGESTTTSGGKTETPPSSALAAKLSGAALLAALAALI